MYVWWKSLKIYEVEILLSSQQKLVPVRVQTHPEDQIRMRECKWSKNMILGKFGSEFIRVLCCVYMASTQLQMVVEYGMHVALIREKSYAGRR